MSDAMDYTLIEYIIKLIRILNQKKERIKELEKELCDCLKNKGTAVDTNITPTDDTPTIHLKAEIAAAKQDVDTREAEIESLRGISAVDDLKDAIDAKQRELDDVLAKLAEPSPVVVPVSLPVPVPASLPVPLPATRPGPTTATTGPTATTGTTDTTRATKGAECIEPIHPFITYNDQLKKISAKPLYDVSDLVRAVVTGAYVKPPVPAEAFLSFKSKGRGDEAFKDEEYELKAIMTGLTTLYFVETPETTMHFIKLITMVFTQGMDEYKKARGLVGRNDIVFLYKGGNALKAIFFEYMYENPGVVTDVIREYFEESFGKSDADFQIFVNPGVPNYESVYNEVTVLSYLLLNRLRNIFLKNITYWLDFYKYKSSVVDDILLRFLKKLNESNAVKDPESFYNGAKFLNLSFLDTTVGERVAFEDVATNIIQENGDDRFVNNFGTYKDRTTRFDFIITPKEGEAGTVILYKIPPLDKQYQVGSALGKDVAVQQRLYSGYSDGSELFITYNEALQFTRPNLPDSLIRFNLVRMKVNFTSVFEKGGKYGLINAPAELIDISIPHKDTYEIKVHMDEPWDKFIDDTVAEYEYIDQDTANNFTFKSYTRGHYMEDLEKMLFLEVEFPWEDEKYQKRIKRLMFLYMAEIFTGDIEAGHKILVEFNEVLSNPGDKGEFKRKLIALKARNPSLNKLGLQFLIDKFIEFCDKPDFDLSGVKVKEYIGVLQGFLVKFEEIYGKFNKFIASGKIDGDRLRGISQLGGGVSRMGEAGSGYCTKYLKYKNKYLSQVHQSK